MIPEKPQEKGRWKALVFTALMHLVLLAVLFFGVQWKRNTPDAVEVELWSDRPQPPAVTPPPPPPEPVKPEPKPEPKVEPKPEPKPPVKPDIAIKEEKKKPKPEPEPKKSEPKRPEPKVEAKAEPRPKEPWREALAREEHDRTMAAQKVAAESEQRAGAKKRAESVWGDRVRSKIQRNIFQSPGLQGNPIAVFQVKLLPSGEVLDVKLTRSSGVPAWDVATERAIYKSSPLPKPEAPAALPSEFELTLCPDERGCR